ncbi:MAG: phosphatase PAP2 family protein [Aestuariivirga sp.]
MDYIQPYLDFFAAHPGWALAIVFLIAFGEALLIIGLFVPSTAVLVGAGILVGTGHLAFWPVLAATTIGAILGDQVSFWAGRFFGESLKTMWPLSRYPQLVARGEDFVRQHGGKSIAIGRFVPGVKSVVPGIVGMFGMKELYFLVVNVSSAIVWGAAHILPGVLIGQGLAFAGELSGRLLFVLLVLLVLLAVGGYIIRLAAAGLTPFLNRTLSRVSAWAAGFDNRSMQRFARAAAPENPRSALLVLFAAIIITGLIAIVNMIVHFASGDAVSNMDVSVFNLMQEMRNTPADELMIAITMMGDGLVISALAIAIVAWLVWHRSYRAALAAAAVILAGKIFVPIMKTLIQRARPIELYQGAEGYSFPSGHATMAALTFGVLAVLVSHSMGRWGRAVVYASCGLVVIAIAYSRVYLGVHWLSDVLGGMLFGAVMAAVYGVVIEAVPPRRIRALGLMGASFIIFLLAGAFHVSTGFVRAEQFYGPSRQTIVLPATEWEGAGWRRLPDHRIDLGGGRRPEPFVAQYAGDIERLAAAFSRAGWRETSRWTWRESIHYLNVDAPLDELAPRPSLHEGLKARLTLIRDAGDGSGQRLVVRAYKSEFAIKQGDADRHLYLVTLTREALPTGWRLFVIPLQLPVQEADLAAFRAVLAQAEGLRVMLRQEPGGMPRDLVIAAP